MVAADECRPTRNIRIRRVSDKPHADTIFMKKLLLRKITVSLCVAAISASAFTVAADDCPGVCGRAAATEKVCCRSRQLEERLREYVAAHDRARIGVAVIAEGRDTVSVNGDRDFPMMSVFKFPLALTVAQWMDENSVSPDDDVAFPPEALMEDTYSPMLKKYGKGLDRLPVRELLQWSLIESDNNAADILLRQVGGPDGALSALKGIIGDTDITIGASEEDMHRDQYLSYLNRSTPLAMAELFDRFDTTLRHRSSSFSEIAAMLEECRTGTDRLPAPLPSAGTVIGHKTGTGFPTPDGRISALNDCGYVHLSDGTRYSIAVFIADSSYGMDETSGIIAGISEIVCTALLGKQPSEK